MKKGLRGEATLEKKNMTQEMKEKFQKHWKDLIYLIKV